MKRSIHLLRHLAYGIGIIAALILIIGWSILFTTRSSLTSGIIVGTSPMGGLTQEEARPMLKQKIETYLETPLSLALNETTTETTPNDLGITFDVEQNIDYLLALNRKGSLIHQAISALTLALNPSRIPLLHSIDQEKLSRTLQLLFPQDEQPAKDAIVKTNRGTISIEQSHGGRIIDRSTFLPALSAAAAFFEGGQFPLRIIDDTPEISTSSAEDAQQRALDLLSHAPFIISVANATEAPQTVLTQRDILDALRFIPSQETQAIRLKVDPATIRDLLLSSITPALNRSPVDMRLGYNDAKEVIVERPALEGIAVLLSKENVNTIIRGLHDRRDTIKLSAILKPAVLNKNRFESLGITHLLAAETTDFSGSPDSRKHNITVGAALYDRIILAPGEEFSFNKLLGDVGPEQGYLPELVIKNNKTIPEYGGGICQVSTTVFRTATFAGLDITKRYAHSYVVRYYGEPGFDATIYPANPDFRFRNDTPGHLLIQTEVIGNRIAFEFYGTDDGRVVSVVGPDILESNPDGSMRTVIRQIVERDGETLREDAFWSSYKPASLYPIIRNPLE